MRADVLLRIGSERERLVLYWRCGHGWSLMLAEVNVWPMCDGREMEFVASGCDVGFQPMNAFTRRNSSPKPYPFRKIECFLNDLARESDMGLQTNASQRATQQIRSS